MTGQDETSNEAPSQQSGGSKYERSSIAFPYFDLAECLGIVDRISQNNGSDDCSDDQIAAWVLLSSKSSGYRSLMSAARLFGLIEPGKQSGNRLSDLALETLNETHSRLAKVKAFLNVPLFKLVYDTWLGQQVPPPAALERKLGDFGVAEKQRARARQVLERSAEAAHFYDTGRDRLIKPGIKGAPPPSSTDNKPGGGEGGASGGSGYGGSGGSSGDDLHPFINGLLQTLPAPNSVWTHEQRKKWLTTAEGIFDLIYEDDGNGHS